MENGAALLRMLEPAVRPVPTPTDPAPARAASAESAQPFEALLSEARQAAGAGEPANESTSEAAAESTAPDPLSPLSQLDQVENASLRRLMA